ncbi:MAG: PQQ-binding-like beta-propeller repeat protein [Candidatus Marinimicrobia bacterium]|jgi:outer membrane protein assembly factor BamB|nr:PQQ-binding-like beta-propeller repeat protein [Candidatus Neomarinimicrobiota bacterium]MDP6593163.1 PQQ-binding-like beta-propeller repeat protein [Candidatus Neomarinimicrobiota bacterium]MDP6836032.1 PQQ-binding-like beta-propeller repeat protein [Candidatus Neomarinimicrobiota bacterium]|tara:strand:+ start:3724 stop:4908 length:1185 start_codon:yes stop_codon:yes gene_type:complete
MKTSHGHILSNIAILSVTAAVISCAGRISLDTEASEAVDWMTEGKDFSRLYHVPGANLTPPLTLVWKEKFIAGISSSPLLAGDRLFLPLLNGELVVLSVKTGKKVARKKLSRGPIFGLTLADSTIYFGVGQRKTTFKAYDIRKGHYDWQLELGPIESAPVVNGRHLYVVSRSRQLYCLNRKDGSVLWQSTDGSTVRDAPIAISGNLVYLDQDGNLIASRMETGALNWTVTLPPDGRGSPQKSDTSPAATAKQIFVTTLSGQLLAYDAGGGALQWRYDCGSPIYTPPSCDGSLVFAAASSGTVFCLNAETGTLVWSYDVGSVISTAPVIAGTRLVVTANRGDIILLNSRSGVELWSDRLQGRIAAAPVIGGSHMVVADDKKTIYLYTATGEESNQ